MSDKPFPDPDASSIDLNTEIIKLLTWNVWWKFENYKERENLIISEINNSCPDILCLQEVWEETDESQAKIIADQLGYNYIFEKSFEFDGVAFGNAIITKFPINSHHTVMFKTEAEKDEKRFLLHLSLKYKSEMINVICTHLNYKYEHQQVREDQVNQIIEYISKLEQSKFPIILCGDFNADPESDEIRKITGLTKPVNDIVLRDVWKLTNRNDPGYTWSNSNDWAKKTLEYNRRIDYIFLGKPGPNGLGHPIECNLVGTEKNKFFPSDHFGLLAHLVGMN